MRKFFVERMHSASSDNLYPYVIKFKTEYEALSLKPSYYFMPVRDKFLYKQYKMRKLKRISLVHKYNGEFWGGTNSTLYFKTETDAQSFLDDILVPYEIAFNLNGELDEKF